VMPVLVGSGCLKFDFVVVAAGVGLCAGTLNGRVSLFPKLCVGGAVALVL